MSSITVAYGDQPELVESALYVLREVEAELTIETIEIGSRVYAMDGAAGILPGAWDSILRTRTLLKGPTAAPPGERFADVSDALRLGMELNDMHRRTRYYYLDPDAKQIISSETPRENAFCIAATASHIGESFALFEISGEPTHNAMLLSAYDTLMHLGQKPTANRIYNAWENTLKEGIYPPEMHRFPGRMRKAGTVEFLETLVARLERK